MCLGRWILIARPTAAYPFAWPIKSRPLDQNRATTASSSSSLPRDASRASSPWQSESWGRSALSHPRPRQRVRAFNAGQCTAPVCPLFTCSRRSSRLCAAENPESTRGSHAVALCLLAYLCSPVPPLVSFTHSRALDSTHTTCLSSSSPVTFGRHCRTSESLVKAVTLCSSLPITGSLSSLLPRLS